MELAATVIPAAIQAAFSRRRKRSHSCTVRSASRADQLRALLRGPDLLKGPCCHDGLSARLIEDADFPIAFMGGFGVSAARLGGPDAGLLSYAEMLDQGRQINEATRNIPIIGDGDTGFGNAISVKRTVCGYAAAGFAGILIEDQAAPKACGHVRGRRVVGRAEAVARIRAAANARDEGANVLIAARTDARQAESLQEALWRVAAFADAGADILFIDALESVAEMEAFCQLSALPKMANMLEGGGCTPLLAPGELHAMGFKLVAYPLSLLGVSIRAMQAALVGLKAGHTPDEGAMGSFEAIKQAVGFPQYMAEAKRYAVPDDLVAEPDARSSLPPSAIYAAQRPAGAATAAAPTQNASQNGGAEAAVPGEMAAAVVEADAVIVAGTPRQRQQQSGQGDDGANVGRRATKLRVLITDTASGAVKLETRIPAGFLDGLSAFIPQVAGVDVAGLVTAAQAGAAQPRTHPLADFETAGDRIRIFLE